MTSRAQGSIEMLVITWHAHINVDSCDDTQAVFVGFDSGKVGVYIALEMTYKFTQDSEAAGLPSQGTLERVFRISRGKPRLLHWAVTERVWRWPIPSTLEVKLTSTTAGPNSSRKSVTSGVSFVIRLKSEFTYMDSDGRTESCKRTRFFGVQRPTT